MQTIANPEELTFAEAVERVRLCVYNKPDIRTNSEGQQYCGHCSLRVVEFSKNKTGYKHYHKADSTKKCNECFESFDNPYESFYTKPNSLDGLSYMCCKCTSKYNAQLKKNQKLSQRRANILLPINIFNAAQAVRGKDTLKQFIIQALRREIERRVTLIERERLRARTGRNDLPDVRNFQCPECDMVTYHPMDIVEGYCGNCNDWTRKDYNTWKEVHS